MQQMTQRPAIASGTFTIGGDLTVYRLGFGTMRLTGPGIWGPPADKQEAIALGEKAGLDKGLLLDVLGQTTVLTPGQKSKLENVKREEYPTNFALSLMHKDFSLVLSQAYDLSVSMPATAAAQQMYTAAMAKGRDADFSLMIQFMEELAGVSDEEHLSNH